MISLADQYKFILLQYDFFIYKVYMNWLRANRLSAKDPLDNASFNTGLRMSVDTKSKQSQDTDFITPQKIKSNPSFFL